MKIGFFETWNKEAGMVEFSITRVQMILMTLFDMFFIYQYFVIKEQPITVNSITLIVVLMIVTYSPKAIKDFTSIKDKIK